MNRFSVGFNQPLIPKLANGVVVFRPSLILLRGDDDAPYPLHSLISNVRIGIRFSDLAYPCPPKFVLREIGDSPIRTKFLPRLLRSIKVKRSVNSTTNQHLRTRRDHANETAEDYVEAIAMIETQQNECRLKDLAAHFSVSHVTVSKILARLSREGLVETTPYAPVKLSFSGVKMAEKARLRHESVLAFLVALGVSASTAQVDAEGIEHHVSDETLRCMKRFVAARK